MSYYKMYHNHIIDQFTSNNKRLTPLVNRGNQLFHLFHDYRTRDIIKNEDLEAYDGIGLGMGWILDDYDLVIESTRGSDGDKDFARLQKDIGAELHKTVKTPWGFECYLRYTLTSVPNGWISEYPDLGFLSKDCMCVLPGVVAAVRYGLKFKYRWHKENTTNGFNQAIAPSGLEDILRLNPLPSQYTR